MNEILKLIPTKTQFAWPMMGQGLGTLLMFIGYCYQSTAKDHPENLPGWLSNPDVATIFGAAVAAGSLLISHGNNQKAQSAFEAATKAPPLDDKGEMSVEHTVGTAAHQSIIEGDPDRAIRLIKALSPDRVSGSKLEGPPDA